MHNGVAPTIVGGPDTIVNVIAIVRDSHSDNAAKTAALQTLSSLMRDHTVHPLHMFYAGALPMLVDVLHAGLVEQQIAVAMILCQVGKQEGGKSGFVATTEIEDKQLHGTTPWAGIQRIWILQPGYVHRRQVSEGQPAVRDSVSWVWNLDSV